MYLCHGTSVFMSWYVCICAIVRLYLCHGTSVFMSWYVCICAKVQWYSGHEYTSTYISRYGISLFELWYVYLGYSTNMQIKMFSYSGHNI